MGYTLCRPCNTRCSQCGYPHGFSSRNTAALPFNKFTLIKINVRYKNGWKTQTAGLDNVIYKPWKRGKYWKNQMASYCFMHIFNMSIKILHMHVFHAHLQYVRKHSSKIWVKSCKKSWLHKKGTLHWQFLRNLKWQKFHNVENMEKIPKWHHTAASYLQYVHKHSANIPPPAIRHTSDFAQNATRLKRSILQK